MEFVNKDFVAEGTCVVAEKTGRLSFFKQLLSKCEPHGARPSVLSFVLCLSLLDKCNLPNTNFATLRSILYVARKIFPNARLGVLLFGNPTDSSSTITQYTAELKSLVETRSPAGCTVLHAPSPFLAANNLLSKATKTAVFSTLQAFLNL